MISVCMATYNGEVYIKQQVESILIQLGDSDELIVSDDGSKDKTLDIVRSFESGADLIVSDCYVVDANAKIINESFFSLRNSKPGLLSNLMKNSFLGCCMAFRASLIFKILPFPKNIPMHDWWIGLIVSVYGNVVFINQPLICYRRHGNNASPTGESSSFSLITQAVHRLILCFYLIRRYLK